MQRIRFEREQMNNYMVIPCVGRLDRNSYGDSLLEHVKVSEFMRYEIREVNGEQTLYYQLQYRTSLRQVLGNLVLTFELMKALISSIVEVIKRTEEYLLDVNCILWKPESIFIEVSSGKLVFAYYPKGQKEDNSIKNLLVELIQYVDRKDQQTYLYLMEFYNLVTNPDCTLEQMEKYIVSSVKIDTELERGSLDEDNLCKEVPEDKAVEAAEPKGIKNVPLKKGRLTIVILALVNLVVALLLLTGIWTYQYIWVLIVALFLLFVAFLTLHTESEEENTDRIMEEYLREYNDIEKRETLKSPQVVEGTIDTNTAITMETTILCEPNSIIVVEDTMKEKYLKSMKPKTYGDVFIKKNSVVLGSMSGGCDYLFKEKGISRMHAKLFKKETGLYLLDLNSTNGTYLNDEQMASGEEYPLEEGDVISLAKVVTFVVVEREIIDS